MELVNGAENRPGARRLLRYLPAVVVAGGLVAGYALGLHRYLSLDWLAASQDWLEAKVAAYPVAAPATFFAVYVAAVAFSFPAASVLSIFGGFLFGWALGGALVACAATIGACLVFLTARSAFGDALRAKVKGPAARMAQGFEENAFGYLLVLRLAPIFPFFVVNIVPALFNVRLATYAAATFIGILPGVMAFCWLGEGVGSVLDAAREAGRSLSIHDLVTPKIMLAFALLALVAAIPLVVKMIKARRQAAR